MAGLNKLQLQVFGRKVNYEPNTFIGGIGTNITTKSALASKLSIPQDYIKFFEVVGTEVQAHISANYNLGVNAFNEDSDVTWYKDEEGKVQSIYWCFRNAINLVEVKFPNCVSVGSGGTSATSSGCFFNCVNLETAIFNNWTTTSGPGYFTFADCVKLNGLDTSKLIGSLSNSFFRNNPQTSYDLSALTNIHGNAFINSGVNDILSMPVLISMPQTGITNCAVKEIYIPQLESINSSSKTNLFSNLTQLTILDAKKLKSMVDPTIRGSGAFGNLKVGCTINVHQDLLTANSGGPDEALVYAKNSRSAIVNFYDDSGNYVSTL